MQCKAEFERLVRIHEVRAFTKADVIDLTLRLDQSQKRKSRCGLALIRRLKALAGVE